MLTSLLAFVHRLRAIMIPVSMVEALDAIASLTHLDLTRRHEVRAALRATLVKRADHGEAFDTLFDLYFPPRPTGPERRRPDAAVDLPSPSAEAEDGASRELLEALRQALARRDAAALQALVSVAVDRFGGITAERDAPARYYLSRVLRRLDLSALVQWTLPEDRDRGDAETGLEARLRRDEHRRRVDELRRLVAEAILDRLLELKGPRIAAEMYCPPLVEDLDFLTASPAQRRAIRRAIQPLARKLATRIAQRRRRRRGRLDVRRTIRRSLSAGGVPLDPAFRHRRIAKPDLYLLCDVSGSVAEFAGFTITLLHALHEEIARIRSFLFVDGIAEVTEALARGGPSLTAAHLRAAARALDVDGQSDYGAVWERFWRDHGQAALGPRTTVIVTGDARNHDHDPGLDALRQIRGRARRVYWLNPEPRSEWNTTDSIIDLYRPLCDTVFEARNLRQLAAFVRHVV